MKSLFNYYETKDIRPTYAAFDDQGQLDKYLAQRRNFFYRLNLPHTFFNGKSILEFGPDTGENALVFAKWGAILTLVEPIKDAHKYIRNYFTKYNMESSIQELIAASLLEFESKSKFEVIDAEGFIYTIQPNDAWIKKAKECLKEDGLFIISYIDYYGGFIELLQKAIYNSVKRSSKFGEGVDTAKHIFLNKWNSIQHTRSIESWFMDVIENPFVRLKYYIDPVTLLKDMNSNEMRLFSSWPTFRDPHSVDWIKKPFTAESELNSSISFIKQNRLSHFFGIKCLMPKNIENIENIEKILKNIINTTDYLIDSESKDGCLKSILLLDDLIKFASDNTLITDDNNSQINDFLEMVKKIFSLIMDDNIEELVNLCQNDKTFISTWGAPTHNAIFQNQ